jgi:molybdate transport system substrate-binding protein
MQMKKVNEIKIDVTGYDIREKPMNRQKTKLGFRTAIILASIGCFLGIVAEAVEPADVIVFAAASTTNAITEIQNYYAAHQLGRVIPSFASSSALAKQIENGAPADVFLSAHVEWMDYLEKKNLVDPKTRFDFVGNRIVLIVPTDSPVMHIDIVPGFSMDKILGNDGRLSIGDPEHVPAGKYGKKALEYLGAWEEVKDRLAPAKDVRAALVMVERGETPLGLVYATDAAISKKVRVVGTFASESHPPIVYPVAVISGGKKKEAKRFLEFLKSKEARAIFDKYGFKAP